MVVYDLRLGSQTNTEFRSTDAWLAIEPSTVAIDFEALWALKPEVRDTIRIVGREVEVPRYVQSYGRDYWFSGKLHTSLPVPIMLQPFLAHARSIAGDEPLEVAPQPLTGYNQLLVNWYPDGKSYIGAHSDNERDLAFSPIYSWSFGATRKFRIRSKLQPGLRYDFGLTDGTLAVMSPQMQREWTHEIVKTQRPVGRRINITARHFLTPTND